MCSTAAARPGIEDFLDTSTALADDVVVVRLWLTGDVGVVAGGQVDTLQHLELGEEIERAEDGGTTDVQRIGDVPSSMRSAAVK